MIYLIMGWVGVIYLPIIISQSKWLFFIFILLGGLAYTIGAWFYAQKKQTILSYDLAYIYTHCFIISFHRYFIFYVGGCLDEAAL